MTAAVPAARPPGRPLGPIAVAGRGVRRFLGWWGDELSDLLAMRPASARAWTVLLLRREGGCEVYLRTRDRIDHIGTSQRPGDGVLTDLRQRLGRRQLAPGEIVLRLQPSEVVQTRLTVPAGARDVIEPIVRNQIDRLAPWPPDKALFAYEIAPAQPGAPTLDVHLAVAGRAQIEGLVAELGDAGFGPGIVDFGTDTAQQPSLNLLAAGGVATGRPGRRLLAAVGVICAAALVVGIVSAGVLVHEQRELASLQARLAELQAKAAAELPSQGSLRRRAWLVEQKRTQPSMAIMLEALSRALPDDAWLDRVEAEHGMVRIAGQAAGAATLIGLIEASGHFAEVKFAAPTTLAEEDSRESFTISGRILPGRSLGMSNGP